MWVMQDTKAEIQAVRRWSVSDLGLKLSFIILKYLDGSIWRNNHTTYFKDKNDLRYSKSQQLFGYKDYKRSFVFLNCASLAIWYHSISTLPQHLSNRR